MLFACDNHAIELTIESSRLL